MDASSSSVKVAVRVRPFNDREIGLSSKCCVTMKDNETVIRDLDNGEPEDSIDPKRFTFDYSFWSHDDYEIDINSGISKPKGPLSRYADQEVVFNAVGLDVLNNAWAGYHCCLFAYGQTGSGKSYSMVGYGPNRGIVPIACEEIFKRINDTISPTLKYEVSISMLEIYNEQVQDLLVHPRNRPKKGLDIRESKQLGVFVQGITSRAVDSFATIERVVAEGTSNRTVGATLMNATSSRAHTVISIEFRQISIMGEKKGIRMSRINLVDLAGSEKAGQTGASGDRLKEGCAINKSLSALGNVISALADKATGKAKPGAIIPYRDSKLTRLLQNALGGSSKTVMICAISPASANYEESLSTLRAKKIKNAAVVNEDPQDKLIRQLREENEKLKALVAGGMIGIVNDRMPEIIKATESMTEEERMVYELEKEKLRKSHEEEIQAMEAALKEMQRSWEERLAEAKEKNSKAMDDDGHEVDLTKPHFTNLNEDPMLNGKIFYCFQEGDTWFGGKRRRNNKRMRGRLLSEGRSIDSIDDIPNDDYDDTRGPPTFLLAGASFMHRYQVCITVSDNGRVTIKADPEAYEAESYSYLNGDIITPDEPLLLNHGDRVILGRQNNLSFVYVDPTKGSGQKLIDDGIISFDGCIEELATKQGDMIDEEYRKSDAEIEAEKRRQEEYERSIREAMEAREKAEAEAKAKEDEYEAKLNDIQSQRGKESEEKNEEVRKLKKALKAQRRKAEKEKEAMLKRQKELEDAENDRRQREIDLKILHEHLMVIMPLCKEASLLAKEMDIPYT
ncbi:hypothetical protein FOL47_006987 [Perkinsus chesapeaki]|uniref:Kinesin-like protein n=1 Tax=Perkinsus chesapeaki TaxID=330153 RepID=A0A7J6N2G8_PERCH|nr:hypothetical protein FOL47_006987 [Perkinsus chesapeaki]